MTKKTSSKKTASSADKKSGSVKKALKFTATEADQSGHKIYVFKAKASVLFGALSINRRLESKDKDEGYQRVLSASRVQAITRHIAQKRPIPTAIIVSFD